MKREIKTTIIVCDFCEKDKKANSSCSYCKKHLCVAHRYKITFLTKVSKYQSKTSDYSCLCPDCLNKAEDFLSKRKK